MSDYISADKCRCCGASELVEVLDLGAQPLANSYHKKDELLTEYPLSINLCPECYHTQLSVVVDPNLMFKNYLYVSGTTKTLKDYFDFFAKFTIHRFVHRNGSRPDKVLDIACNDGTQLDCYAEQGLSTYGIDPAENLIPRVSPKHKVICGYFPEDGFQEDFDIIIAQNVFAHTHDIESFMTKCKELLRDEGVIYIQTSQSNMFERNEFDTIYHEHLSFFNSKSMKAIVDRCGLVLNNVFKFDIHGSSYIFEISKKNFDSNLESVLSIEENKGLYSIELYEEFSKNASRVVNDLKNKIEEYRSKGNVVVGYGAAAKGMTLLNFGSIELDFIVDDNPMKVGLLTPGTNTEIFGPEVLNSVENLVVVPLAWNFFSEIKNRVSEYRNGETIFIKYFPEIEVVCE